jgi:lysophospholipase L1-like esterase
MNGLLRHTPSIHKGLTKESFSPVDIVGGQVWYNSDNKTVVGSKVSVLKELFHGVNHCIQETDSKRPTIDAAKLNGHDAIVFDGLTQRMLSTNVVNQTQPFTIYLVVKHLTSKTNAAFAGAGAPVQAHPAISVGNYRLYAGSFTDPIPVDLVNNLAFHMEINGASSEMRKNELTISTDDAGSNDLGNKVVIGAQVDADAQTQNFEFYEYILYDGVHDSTIVDKIWKYFQNRYNDDFGRPELRNNKFDGIMDNSVIYSQESGYNKRNSFSEYSFNTNDDLIYIKGVVEQQNLIHVYEDDVYSQSISITGGDLKPVTLSAGMKKTTLINDWNTAPVSEVLGCFLTDLRVFNYEKVQTQSNDQIVLWGDSISVGGNATNPVNEGYGRLIQIEEGVQTAHLGWAYSKLSDIAATSGLISEQMAYMQTLFTGITGRKIVLIQIGVNDISAALSAEDFETYYGNFIDAIRALDTDIEVYCPGVLPYDGESALAAAYRTAVSDLCSTRAWATYITPTGIITYPGDYADAVHPNTSGHDKLKDAFYTVIYP